MSENGGDDDQSDDSDDCTDSARDRRPVGDVSLSIDTTLELLADHDRRVVIDYLQDGDDRTVTIDELATYLASRTDECAADPPSADRVQTMLHHVHVPKLVDTGVVDYDARNEEVRYWGSERLERWHERIRNRDD
ncbi:DUF7344 domain-containing protein [Halorussus lipolyticus]|uniref:DUF7344 domain-containing protein n=1 Tax=Halorussus lipolyticus TaxID=3034024 RepID=UPI0023E8AC79|nr:hypothetical protein [Halorussus sp. DT80]